MPNLLKSVLSQTEFPYHKLFTLIDKTFFYSEINYDFLCICADLPVNSDYELW